MGVSSRYNNENKKNRSMDDAFEIAKLLKKKDAYDLVLRQTVSNVQGADVLVLSKGERDQENIHLDLYQAKHYSKFPAVTSDKTIGAFASLGVLYDRNKKVFNTEPKIGSAGYSFLGTQKFVKELGQRLETKVMIRKRVIVFSNGFESFKKSGTWKHFDLEAAR